MVKTRTHTVIILKEGNVLFHDVHNNLYLRLYCIGHMVNDHSDSERGNPLSPHWLLFPINSKGSFICTIPQTGALAGTRNSSMSPPHEGSFFFLKNLCFKNQTTLEMEW